MPTITVVTPAYNSASRIGMTIDSVKAQTFSDWEMIIVDDCSTDETVDVVNAYAKLDPRIRLIKLGENSGAAVARNAAICAANGRYISFLDSDDRWLPHKLDSQINFVRAHDAAFVFSAYRRVDEAGNVLVEVGVPSEVCYQQLLKSNFIGCLTAMYDTRKIEKIETPIIRANEDLSLWLRLLKRVPVAYGQNEVLALYTVRRGSVSADKRKTAKSQWEIYREVEEISLLASFYYFIHYAVRGVLRTYFPHLACALGVMHNVDRADRSP